MLLKELPSQKTELFTFFKRLILSCIGWILLVPVIIGSFIVRQCVNTFLTLKLKHKYGGLYDKGDVVWLMPDASRCWECSIVSILFIKCSKKTEVFNEFTKILKEKVFDHPESFPKLTSTMHMCAGYPYWIKNDVDVDEVVKPIEVPEDGSFDEEYVKEVAASIGDQPFSKHGSLLWSLHVSPVPLNTNDGFYHYPVITRFQHSLGDGTSLIAVLIKLFGNNNCNNYSEEVFRKLYGSKKLQINRKSINKTAYSTFTLAFEMLFTSLGNILITDALRSPDKNALKTTNNCYSGHKHVAYYTETHPGYLRLIKDIKNKEGTKFICVLITAYLASVTSYFEENSLPIPESFTIIFAVVIGFTDTDLTKPVPLENKALPAILSFPSVTTSSCLKESLRIVSGLVRKEIRYSDLLLIKFLWPFLGNLPLNLVKHFGSFINQTLLLTNIPGGSKIGITDNSTVDRIVPFAPVMKGVGVSLAIITYDDRLQIGLATDRKVISRENTQKIVDDLLINIKRLHAECLN